MNMMNVSSSMWCSSLVILIMAMVMVVPQILQGGEAAVVVEGPGIEWCERASISAMAYCGPMMEAIKQNNLSDLHRVGPALCCSMLASVTHKCGCVVRATAELHKQLGSFDHFPIFDSGIEMKVIPNDFLTFIQNNTQTISDTCGPEYSQLIDSKLNNNPQGCSLATKIVQGRERLRSAKGCDQKAQVIKEEVCASKGPDDGGGGDQAKNKNIRTEFRLEDDSCCTALNKLTTGGECICAIRHRKFVQLSNETFDFFDYLVDNQICGKFTYNLLDLCKTILDPPPPLRQTSTRRYCSSFNFDTCETRTYVDGKLTGILP